jgi:hypothetical protein
LLPILKQRGANLAIHFTVNRRYVTLQLEFGGGIMSVQMTARAIAFMVGGAAGLAAAAPYTLAFLTSTAVEVIAVATVFTMLAFGLGRSILRSSAIGDHWQRLYRAFDVLKLSKMLIPLACLSATVWVWSLIQGA